MRITPKLITELQPNEIFVFGSNTSGRHGKGAAKTAMKWGAKYGVGEGLQGRTYGIPTVNASITRSLSYEKIQKYVDNFIECAKQHPELTFLTTLVGCGLAGLNIDRIGAMFATAKDVQNIHLPIEFWRALKFQPTLA